MKEKLQRLLNNSYSPYSNFQVSAIVTTKDGQSFSGVNVENASYGATICAERVAITKAISEGYKKGDFDKLYIMVNRDMISTCCFLCRQMIVEFFEANSEIICMNKEGISKTFLVSDLCTEPFSEDDLK